MQYFKLFIFSIFLFGLNSISAQNHISVLTKIDTNSQNLLVNPGAETGDISGWIDPDDAWNANAAITPHSGSYFFWPAKKTIPYTQIYQDVDVSNYSANTYFHLSGWLANWNQAPHDKATLAISALDINGSQLLYISREHRNPVWEYYEIITSIPLNCKTLRVSLTATRFVGSDNDGYFDDLYLGILDSTPNIFVNITSENNKKDVEIENTLQLTAYTTGATDSKYKWSSSYDAIASVDSNGLVTAHSSGTFTIQAIGNTTKTIGYITLVSHPHDYIAFSNPVGGEEWLSKSNEKITWNLFGSVGSSTLFWSNNNGADWEELSTFSDPSVGEYIWNIPDSNKVINNCLLKMSWSANEITSSHFTIIPFDSSTVGISIIENTPKKYFLQNYPNPFNPTTTIKYSIPLSSGVRHGLKNVTLKVYDILGNEIATLVNEVKQPGVYEVQFDASKLTSGVYYYQLISDNYFAVKRMVLLK